MSDGFESKGHQDFKIPKYQFSLFLNSLILLTNSRGEFYSSFIARESEAQIESFRNIRLRK